MIDLLSLWLKWYTADVCVLSAGIADGRLAGKQPLRPLSGENVVI